MTDWIKGFPYTALDLRMPRGYGLHVSIRQHQSGKVTVRQSITKTIGHLDLRSFKTSKLDFDTSFMDKLNKVLIVEKTVKSKC